MIDQKRLKELVKLMVENDLTELDLQDDTQRVSLKRNQPGSAAENPVMALPVAPGIEPGVPEPPPADAGQGDLTPIKSPMVGTFYTAPSPDTDPFIKVGDRVDSETVICIIEAMKVFNEIKAEASGTVEKICVENGHAVEFGQPLFMVKPD